MSGLGDPSGTRLVAMTQAQRDRLSEHGWYRTDEIVAAYDAAPADPAEAIAEVLTRLYGSVTLTWGDERVVLAALGVPANPANEDHQ